MHILTTVGAAKEVEGTNVSPASQQSAMAVRIPLELRQIQGIECLRKWQWMNHCLLNQCTV